MEAHVAATEPMYKYRSVAQVLRAAITDGTYPPGSLLPKQDSLVRRFTVSRSTVQRALKELEDEGLVESHGRGRSPVVRGASAGGQVYGEYDVTLAQSLRDAFRAEHVKIDAYSLSAETLNQAIGPEILRMRRRRDSGEPIPKSVTVRALLADPDADLLVGAPADDPSDTRPRERIATLLRVYSSYLGRSMALLGDTGAEPRVSVHIRTLAATPLIKVYLLNNVELLQGHYLFQRRMMPVDSEGARAAAFDALGSESVLFRFSAAGIGDDSVSAALVRHTQEWFDRLWQTVARPARLTA